MWIELLKSAYYKTNTSQSPHQSSTFPSPQGRIGGALETLPNIDINIKCGNSLVSRFAIDADLSQALKKSKYTIDSYRIAVDTYRNAQSKEQKREMEKLIANIKTDFKSEISLNDPKIKALQKLNGQVLKLTTEQSLFEKSKKEKAEWNKQLEKITTDSKKLEAEIEEIKANKIYENAFEWRFEFPEVLNDNGDFVGFDVVIGNPPYISVKEISKQEKEHYLKIYFSIIGQFDLYQIFAEKSFSILKKNGAFSMITSNTFISNKDCKIFRKYLIENTLLTELINLDENVFTDANLDVSIFSYQKNNSQNYFVKVCKTMDEFNSKKYNFIDIHKFCNDEFDFQINLSEFDIVFFRKISLNKKLDDIVNINRGIEFGGNNVNLKSEISEGYYPLIVGGDISKYAIKKINKYSTFDFKNKSVFKDFELYSSKKIFIQRIRNLSLKDRIVATLSNEIVLSTNTLRILTLKENFNLNTLLGILNSSLINYFFKKKFSNKDIYAYQLAQIPIIEENEKSSEVAFIVDNILDLKKQNPTTDTTHLENQIDQLVYALYDLTAEEIAVVEGEVK